MTKRDFRNRRALFEGRRIAQYRHFEGFKNDFGKRRGREMRNRTLIILAMIGLMLGLVFFSVSAQDSATVAYPEHIKFSNTQKLIK